MACGCARTEAARCSGAFAPTGGGPLLSAVSSQSMADALFGIDAIAFQFIRPQALITVSSRPLVDRFSSIHP